MSSRTKRSRGHNWSDWVLDEINSQWYQARKKSDGTWQYRYRPFPSEEVPRSESDSINAINSQYHDAGSPNLYYNANNYGYSNSPQPSSSVDALSSDLSSINLNSSSASNECYGTAASSSENTSISGYSTTQPTPIQSPWVSPPKYSYTPTASSGPYMGSYGGQNFYPASSSSNYQTSQLHNRPSYSNYADGSGSSSYESASTIVPSFYSSQNEASTTYEGSSEGNRVIAPEDIHKVISPTKGKEKSLDKKYRIHGSSRFTPGQVFKILWAEPKGTSGPQSLTTITKFGESPFQSIRRFVIVAADDGHCQCLPILTYKGQGTLKVGAKGDTHAIIYASNDATKLPPVAKEGEFLTKTPIRMIPSTPQDKLEPQSRLNYAKIYTVEHNVKVWFIGHIAQESRHTFMIDFDSTWNAKRQMR